MDQAGTLVVGSDAAWAPASLLQLPLPQAQALGPDPEEARRKDGARFLSSEMLSSFRRDGCQVPHYTCAYQTLKLNSPSQVYGRQEAREPEEHKSRRRSNAGGNGSN